MVDTKIFTRAEKKFVKEYILGGNFPWYWHPFSTEWDNVPFMAHILVGRTENRTPEEPLYNSRNAPFFVDIVKRFAKKHKLKVNEILRGCLNQVVPKSFIPKGATHTLEHTKSHVDHDFPHHQIIMYLNKSDGDTIIELPNKKIKRIKPEPFKMVCFKEYSHYYYFPKKTDRRVVGVITFR